MAKTEVGRRRLARQRGVLASGQPGRQAGGRLGRRDRSGQRRPRSAPGAAPLAIPPA
jgi:hypothetical protein